MKDITVFDQRMKLIEMINELGNISEACRQLGIPRSSCYEYIKRYEKYGPEGLYNQSRRPFTSPREIPEEVKVEILKIKKRHNTWGGKKIRSKLLKENLVPRVPTATTINNVLRKAGYEIKKPYIHTPIPTTGTLTVPEAANDVWGIDFKGDFKTKDGRKCYPLTVTDLHSRFIISIEGMGRINWRYVQIALTEAFEKYGMPKVIRSDNGTPFASHGLLGWSKISVWLKRLGIKLERIKKGKPTQNSTHERMHLTLKQDTLRPVAADILLQQEKFNKFKNDFNFQRPHEGIGNRYPSELYEQSPRRFPKELEEPDYPFHDGTLKVDKNGNISFEGIKRIRISTILSGETIGFKELNDGQYLLSFMDEDIGHLTADGKFRQKGDKCQK